MSQRIPKKIREEIFAAIFSGETATATAERFGVAEKTARMIYMRRVKYSTELSFGIPFADVVPYWCHECSAMVDVLPCPACEARKVKNRH